MTLLTPGRYGFDDVALNDRIETAALKRPTSQLGRGILRLEVTAVNQRAEVVQRGHNLLMVYR